jgi:hypothetical protein
MERLAGTSVLKTPIMPIFANLFSKMLSLQNRGLKDSWRHDTLATEN